MTCILHNILRFPNCLYLSLNMAPQNASTKIVLKRYVFPVAFAAILNNVCARVGADLGAKMDPAAVTAAVSACVSLNTARRPSWNTVVTAVLLMLTGPHFENQLIKIRLNESPLNERLHLTSLENSV